MTRGAIILVPFPFTDLSGQKVRPALVVHASKRGEDCIVAFITSGKAKRVHSFDVPIEPSPKNGLKTHSIVKIDKLATLQKKIVFGEIGTLDAPALTTVKEKLRLLFQL